MAIEDTIQTLTMRELDEVETVSGVSIASLDESDPPIKLSTALFWILKRKTDPTFTWDQAQDSTLAEVGAIVGEDPTPAA